jgi:GTP-binding protein EngB required for normal cell division
MTDFQSGFSDNQKRPLSARIRHVAGLLDDIERILILGKRPSPLNPYVSDLTPSAERVVLDLLAQGRRALAQAAERHGIDPRGQTFDARRTMDVYATTASIGIEEMRSRYLKGYGALDPAAADEIERTADALERTIRQLRVFLRGGAEEDFEERLRRLETGSVSSARVATLERVIREYGLVEFRPVFRTLLERLEERTFNVALFGRVSSGKSSLLNALLGAAILPTGVTPVTSVPARIRLGGTASIGVRYADGRRETLALDALAQLASEAYNPGNVKGVARLEVIYPARDHLAEGIEFVDTPGIGSLATAGAAEALSYLPRTDLAVILVDVGSSVGEDELKLLRLFYDAAIPVEIVLSKADLADGESLAKMRRHVESAIGQEIRMQPFVGAVSSIESHRPVLDSWFEERIGPLLERRRDLLDRSIQRIAGRLSETVANVLRVRLEEWQGDAPRVSEVRREADGRLADLRRDFETLPEIARDQARAALEAAGESLASSWNARQESDARAVIAAVGVARAEEIRRRVMGEIERLHSDLTALAGEAAGGAAEVLAVTFPSPDFGGLPILDVDALLPALSVRPPWIFPLFPAAGKRHLRSVLGLLAAPPLVEGFRVYGLQLRDWALRTVASAADAFHAAVGAFEPAHAPADRRSAKTRDELARDIRSLLAGKSEMADAAVDDPVKALP